jgi:putative photosynthetic complex assembly protein 2
MDFVLPPLAALIAWWFGTGAVMWLDGLPRRSAAVALAVATVVAVAALVCISRTAQHTSVGAAYAGFACAILVWAWHELAFLTGWLTGPRKRPCSAPAHGPTRFHEGVQVILWHELAIIVMAALIAAITLDAPNQVATWTFVLLWLMRLSAKLNLFLGVRNRGEEMLPPHLGYLGSYFRHRTMNPLLPLSLLAGGACAVALAAAAVAAGGAARAGLLLVASMLVLALIEHLAMVAPMRVEQLWRWAQREPSLP